AILSDANQHLPLLEEATAGRFIAEAGVIMAAGGWAEVSKTKSKTNTNAPLLPLGTKVPNPYYHFALKDECSALAAMPKDSGRNDALNRAAFNLFQLVAGGGLDENVVRGRLFAAAETCGLVAEDGAASVRATIASGAKAVLAQPRHASVHGGDRDDHQHEQEDGEQSDDDDLAVAVADDLEMCGVDCLWPGRFARGKFGLIAGLPDMGKGQIAAFI